MPTKYSMKCLNQKSSYLLTPPSTVLFCDLMMMRKIPSKNKHSSLISPLPPIMAVFGDLITMRFVFERENLNFISVRTWYVVVDNYTVTRNDIVDLCEFCFSLFTSLVCSTFAP